MQTVSVSALESGLSRYIESVKAGEEVVVTEHGEAIARVIPYAQHRSPSAEVEDEQRAGVIRPPKAVLPADFWDQPRPVDPDGFALAALMEEREEGR